MSASASKKASVFASEMESASASGMQTEIGSHFVFVSDSASESVSEKASGLSIGWAFE